MPSSSPIVFATMPFAPSAPTSVSRDDVRLPHRRRDPFGADLEPVDAGVVPERRAGSGCLLREVRVEPPPLGHQDQRLGRGALEAALVVEPELEGVDDALDHRRHVARRLLQRPAGEPATAGLVAREARAVGEQHALAAAREMDRRRRSGRPGTDDEDIEVLHRSIVGRAAGREPRVRLRRPALASRRSTRRTAGRRSRSPRPAARPWHWR